MNVTLSESRSAILSLQILQEYYAGATRKLQISPEMAQSKVELLSSLPMVRLRAEDLISAVELHRLHRVSFFQRDGVGAT